MNIFQKLDEHLKQFLEMSPNYRKDQTNLPAVIYVSQAEGGHGPRIKFQNQKSDRPQNDKWIPMTIEDNPRIIGNNKLNLSNKELNRIKAWVIQNKNTLLDFWYMRISLEELENNLTKLP